MNTRKLRVFFLATFCVLLLIVVYEDQLHLLKQWSSVLTLKKSRICQSYIEEDLLLMVVVNSQIDHFDERLAIRETWGSEAYKGGNKGRFRLAFILGSSTSNDINMLAEAESRIFKDIIQSNITETYRNLTLKSLALLKWSKEECQNAQYLLKSDDDMYINIPNIFRAIANSTVQKNFMLGYLHKKSGRYKDPKHKYHIPDSQYPGDILPDFLSGTAYLMPGEVVSKIHFICENETEFKAEDVLITGICAERLGIQRLNVTGFNFMRIPVTGCALRDAISNHKVSPSELRKIWSELQNPMLQCEKPVTKDSSQEEAF